MRRALLAAIALAAVLAAPARPSAQEAPLVRVLGGEHAGFTRIVLQAAAPIDWTLLPADRTAILQIRPAEARIDLSRAFDRIARNRLAALENAEGGIALTLGCDCLVRAFSDRPGIVVLDILDPPPEGTAGARGQAGDARPPASVAAGGHVPGTANPDSPSPTPFPADVAIGRDAGATLARRWQESTETPVAAGSPLAPTVRARAPVSAPPPPPGLAERQALSADLQNALARAIGQGLMIGDEYLHADMNQPVPEPATTALPPAQMRIAPPPGPDEAMAIAPTQAADATPPEIADPRCHASGALDFLDAPDPPDFNAGLADLVRRLYGEFDRPDAQARSDLVRHYLSAGMGAEARLLIDNAHHPIAGRDFLRGLADILEDRQSNARLALARLEGCPGAGGMLAALAGPAPADLAAHAEQIALAHAAAPPALRRLFGPPLVERLIETGALEAARVIAETLRHTGPAGVVETTLPEALLEGARGAPDRAARSLAAQPGATDAGRLLRQLQFQLEAGNAADSALLDQAEALAAGERHGEQGIALMAVAISHDAARGAHEAGFERLDRLQRWLRANREDRQLLASLSDTLWQGAADEADDRRFLALIVNREDWRADERGLDTRTALAGRLLDLGLAERAEGLISPPRNDRQRHLLAQAMLARARPDEAIAVLSPMMADTPEGADRQSAMLMARALRAAGAGDAALAAFSDLGALDEAARTAIAHRDWQALAALARQAGEGNAPGEPGTEAPQSPPAPGADAASAGTGAAPPLPPLSPAPREGSVSRPSQAAPAPGLAALEQLARILGGEPETVAAWLGRMQAQEAPEGADTMPGAASNDAPPFTSAPGVGTGPSFADSQAAGTTGTGSPDAGNPDSGGAQAGDALAGNAGSGGVGSGNASMGAIGAGTPIAGGNGNLMLHRNAALLEQSAELRTAIDALLQGGPP
ncbi:MAG: hypothetical protein JJT95_11045 [Pararhodobacter sp.]|nr:hypothetical protein [Pararhodobacter sp.]